MYTTKEYDIYLKVKRELLLEDARNYVVDYLENEDERALNVDDIPEEELESYDYENLVERFEEHFDHFDPFEEVWQNIVRDYFEEM